MASNNENNPQNGAARPRRGSITSQTFNNLFGRSNGAAGTPAFPAPISTAAAQDQRRRLSVTGIGLSGTSPNTQATPFAFGGRRSSVSTAGSDSIDESAIEDDDGPGRSQPTTPFGRRMSFGAQALRSVRNTGGSPNSAAEGGGFNWSEQLRSRAENSVTQAQRPLISSSPPNKNLSSPHDRAKSVSEMQTPPAAIPPPAAARPERKKPDAFQERILKGDFYMD